MNARAHPFPPSPASAPAEHVDVLIVGGGLSGIGAGYRLQKRCPGKRYVILEGREATGGTWDLFRFPGIRSDSDMHTMAYGFRPWHGDKAIADGPSILAYLRETAREYGIDRNIRLLHRVKRASWSSADARWTVEVEVGKGPDAHAVTFTCNFLFLCSGYYNYEHGYRPTWPGEERFRGTIAHPQFWPASLDYAGKRVVVIGSGATAVTLVPAMARSARHVVMLQRSPTYIVSLPSRDPVAKWLHRLLPHKLAYGAARWKNVLRMLYFRRLAARRPERMKRYLIRLAKRAIGPGFDVDRHLTPRYNVWDQRLCLVPDGDLFAALRDGSASIVTDEIQNFTETGIRLKSGGELPADIIVTATGLDLSPVGGIQLVVDDAAVDVARSLTYKGLMLSDVPNLAITMGYTAASWTLKSDLAATWVCRLLNHMDRRGYAACQPRRGGAEITDQLTLNLKSGYVLRARDRLPRQGVEAPWKMNQNYARDLVALGFGAIEDGVMAFSHAPAAGWAR